MRTVSSLRGLSMAIVAALSSGNGYPAPTVGPGTAPVETTGEALVTNRIAENPEHGDGDAAIPETRARIDSNLTTEKRPNEARSDLVFAATREPLLGPQATERPHAIREMRDQDPVLVALRSAVDLQRRPGAPASPAWAYWRQNDPHRTEPEGSPLSVELDEDFKAMAFGIKAEASGLVHKIFDPQAEEVLNTNFSTADVEGLQLNRTDIGFSGAVNSALLGGNLYGADPDAYGTAATRSQRSSQGKDLNLINEFIQIINTIINHPLTWLVLLIVAFGRIAIAVVSMKAARHRR